jgi:hypothetical protein
MRNGKKKPVKVAPTTTNYSNKQLKVFHTATRSKVFLGFKLR